MKKKQLLLILLALVMTFSFAACGGDSSEGGATNETEQEKEEPTEEFYFKDNVAVLTDVKIEITDYKILAVGEGGNEYGDVPLIVFYYDVTNLSGSEDVTASGAWIAVFDALQDNDPNVVNELEVGMFSDENLPDGFETIKKDGTASDAIAYELADETTPVTLKATKGLGGIELGEQTFEIR